MKRVNLKHTLISMICLMIGIAIISSGGDYSFIGGGFIGLFLACLDWRFGRIERELERREADHE